jgi:hypothetical protein
VGPLAGGAGRPLRHGCRGVSRPVGALGGGDVPETIAVEGGIAYDGTCEVCAKILEAASAAKALAARAAALEQRKRLAKKGDAVNRPEYYTRGRYHLTDVLMDWFPTAPLLWSGLVRRFGICWH